MIGFDDKISCFMKKERMDFYTEMTVQPELKEKNTSFLLSDQLSEKREREKEKKQFITIMA